MHHGNILYFTIIRQVKVFQLQIGNNNCVKNNTENQWCKLTKCVRLMKSKNKGKPVFGLIRNHVYTF